MGYKLNTLHADFVFDWVEKGIETAIEGRVNKSTLNKGKAETIVITAKGGTNELFV